MPRGSGGVAAEVSSRLGIGVALTAQRGSKDATKRGERSVCQTAFVLGVAGLYRPKLTMRARYEMCREDPFRSPPPRGESSSFQRQVVKPGYVSSFFSLQPFGAFQTCRAPKRRSSRSKRSSRERIMKLLYMKHLSCARRSSRPSRKQLNCQLAFFVFRPG